MNSDYFYQNLKSFQDFSSFSDERYFTELPSDWQVIITDVKGSTDAVEMGQYKDVNTIGAATIAAVQNALGDFEFPYVFGGDGSTIAVPASKFEEAKNCLLNLKKLAQKKFKLELRVGAMKSTDIKNSGSTIKVAKFELTHGKSVAFFKGGGLSFAESQIKDTPNYDLGDSDSSDSNLRGLSCRWTPIKGKRGVILSLLVSKKENQGNIVYENVFKTLNNIYRDNLELANPFNLDGTDYKSSWECIRDEYRYHSNPFSFSFIKRMFEILSAVGIFKYGLNPVYFDQYDYAESMGKHSDYRKFDDTLKMTLDCSADEAEEIKDYLDRLHSEGMLNYGVSESDVALMTCLVKDVKEGQHIHFIDGGSGGYTMAAKAMKDQIELDKNSKVFSEHLTEAQKKSA